MPKAYRIVKAKRASDALSGEGARRQGGRWNTKRSRMIYCAGSVSLAALEMLVHLDTSALLTAYVVFELEFDDEYVTQIASEDLPANWQDIPAPPELQLIGDRWVAERSSLVLRVPSAVVPTEWNYLINSDHPDFANVKVKAPLEFAFDGRLVSRKQPTHIVPL